MAKRIMPIQPNGTRYKDAALRPRLKAKARIRQFREENPDISIADLSDMLGFTPGSVRGWITKDSTPGPAAQVQIAELPLEGKDPIVRVTHCVKRTKPGRPDRLKLKFGQAPEATPVPNPTPLSSRDPVRAFLLQKAAARLPSLSNEALVRILDAD